MTLREIADELGLSIQRVNTVARELYPRGSSDRYSRWELSPAQTDAIRGRLAGGRDVDARREAPARAEHPAASQSVRPLLVEFNMAREALRMRAQADRILAGLGVTRNGFGLVGQLAELLVTHAFNGVQTSASTAGYDVETRYGRKIQVKARLSPHGVLGNHIFMRNFGPGSHPFDDLIYLQFNPDYELEWAVRFPIEVVQPLARYVPHPNSWRLLMTSKVLALGEDVSVAIRAAYDAL